jgi:hypothetical protein
MRAEVRGHADGGFKVLIMYLSVFGRAGGFVMPAWGGGQWQDSCTAVG